MVRRSSTMAIPFFPQFFCRTSVLLSELSSLSPFLLQTCPVLMRTISIIHAPVSKLLHSNNKRICDWVEISKVESTKIVLKGMQRGGGKIEARDLPFWVCCSNYHKRETEVLFKKMFELV
ncbi:hypothetical protein CDAR_21911 [Caerostris darwini]|uniref:Uncharacterized protein n=1 Tax=Caerostris darwini TaxID=1538125 RepID=A0AAV4VWV4_9ARAC|nr:hypothetical protein CDAR_21911 [Caerostris darwini]